MDVFEDGSEYRLLLELPGVGKEGIEVAPGPVAGTLSVKAQGAVERRGQHAIVLERGVRTEGSRFERLIPVAWDADVARTRFTIENGLLALTVPKKSAAAETETKRSK